MSHSSQGKPVQIFSELRSEEVQELLTRPPAWLLRWGLTILTCVLLLVGVGAWLIRYPDLVHASFKLTSTNAPRVVLTKSEGKLIQLLAKEGQSVKAGMALAYLESTAHHETVLQLSQELKKAWTIASDGNLEGLYKLNLSGYGQLGELQNDYQIFEQAHIQLRSYLYNGFYSKKKTMLQQEVKDLQALALNLQEQHDIQAQDMRLAQEDYDVQQKLYNEKVISKLELRHEESKNIGRRLPYTQTTSALISNLTSQRAKQKEVLELDRQVAEERDKFLQSLNTLQSATDAWRAKYIVTAPVSGHLYLPGTLQENQSVGLNQELFYVAPPDRNYVGELYIQQLNAGKVVVGQHVLIKFAGFPYNEFGAVRGRISAIADIPFKDSVFLARVTLPTGLTTTYGKSLDFKTGMTASADILTDNSRLLEKLFYQLRKLTNGR